jgi:hypothetical protein
MSSNSDSPNIDSAGSRTGLPVWMLVIVLLILVTSHSQVTLRHLALRVAGVRYGNVSAVEVSAKGSLEIVDKYGVYKANDLAGDTIWVSGQKYAVAGNTGTRIQLETTTAEHAIEFKDEYLTGVREKTLIVRAALAFPRINFTLADCLLGLGLLALAVHLLMKRQMPQRWLPSAGIILFLCVCLFSLFDWARLFCEPDSPTDIKAGIKELIQYAEVWVFGYLFFVEVLRRPRVRKAAVITLLAMFALMVVVALVEYGLVTAGKTARGLLDVGEIDSLFGFRYNPERSNNPGTEAGKNVLAAYLMFMLPFAIGAMKSLKPLWQRLVIGLFACLSLVCILHAGMLLVALAGCLVVGMVSCPRWGGVAVIGAFLIVLTTACTVLPQHGKILLDSVALSRTGDTYGLQPLPMKGEGLQNKKWDPWQQKYTELQAALNAVGTSPVLGHGLGGYQKCINAFFSGGPMYTLDISKSPVNLMEKNAHGLYTVQAVETGVLGLACLLGLLAAAAATAMRLRGSTEDPGDRALLLGVAGALVAILLGGWLMSFLMRGLSLIAIALIALPAAIEKPGEPADTA